MNQNLSRSPLFSLPPFLSTSGDPFLFLAAKTISNDGVVQMQQWKTPLRPRKTTLQWSRTKTFFINKSPSSSQGLLHPISAPFLHESTFNLCKIWGNTGCIRLYFARLKILKWLLIILRLANDLIWVHYFLSHCKQINLLSDRHPTFKKVRNSRCSQEERFQLKGKFKGCLKGNIEFEAFGTWRNIKVMISLSRGVFMFLNLSPVSPWSTFIHQ